MSGEILDPVLRARYERLYPPPPAARKPGELSVTSVMRDFDPELDAEERRRIVRRTKAAVELERALAAEEAAPPKQQSRAQQQATADVMSTSFGQLLRRAL